ncbi:long-chain-fatty-acid--CoA ligase [Acidianus manzaensis]|uniref:Long-chain fatty acid--CoA ligase n=1 Tax=Acidianus manzaensis TaxID=282676 RepID=A0A1W6JZ59_9CREN|nr:long-chain-fatty-acid--CoA ligase [Acidianus manzaensis]ARM75527.1 long-chain fatty acid--CoA ligase [Acidianus manzaensis]
MSSKYFEYQLTVDNILETGVTTFPNREIVYRDIRRYTFSSFSDSVKRLLSGLKKNINIKQGDRIGVMDWDTDVYLHAYYSVPMSGAVLHTVNIRYPPELILKTVLQAEDKYLIVRDEFLPLVEKAANFIPVGMKIITYNDNKEKVKSSLPVIDFWELVDSNEPSEPENLNENMMATLFFTSGTTGEPKGVWFTHRKLVLHALGVSLVGGRPPLNLSTKDTYLILVPMFHVHSWGYPYVFMLNGVKYVLPGRYDYGLILKLMDREKVTFSAMVPTILYLLISHPDANKYSNVFKNWKVTIGGSALPEGLARKAQELGITVLCGYGLSETCPVITVSYYNSLVENDNDENKFYETITAGAPLPFVKIKIFDPITGKEKNRGEIGEVVVRSPWLTQEYYKDPEKTEALWKDGWLHTGDLGFIDDKGYLHIVDREKDAIKSGGEFIPSLLLEDVISLHPKVSQVAVVGVKDEKWGERPVAFIVPKGDLKEEELRSFLNDLANKGRIQKWWIPDRFIFINTMPLTSTNKIDKKALRDQIK